MEIAEITMDKKVAREHFRVYRKLVRKRASKEDVALMRGFRALSKGQQVIDLFVTMRNVGLDERQRPRLAICRADAENVYFHHEPRGAGRFSMDQASRGHAMRATRRFIAFPSGTFTDGTVSRYSPWRGIKALVPKVPAHLRPAAAISNYHVLWEPEWEEEPPRDPILLKRIARFTFVVLAQWDLTELERSVLRGV